ncbi:hypothetical protein [Saccharopolyspora sp. NPDC049426]|uniref:hypothetical protein n=1 Tax=Saccharopolyspora sp. NPDC049426 TaxID=3155652 RepID=UPI003433D991
MNHARVYEIRVDGFASLAEAIAAQDPIAHLLCPDEWHRGPCEIPWSLGVADDPGDLDRAALVVGVLTTREKALELLRPIGEVTGRSAVLVEADPSDHEELVEQHRIEALLAD